MVSLYLRRHTMPTTAKAYGNLASELARDRLYVDTWRSSLRRDDCLKLPWLVKHTRMSPPG